MVGAMETSCEPCARACADLRPIQVVPLFAGGAFDSQYNVRKPVSFRTPAGAVEVYLYAVITGMSI